MALTTLGFLDFVRQLRVAITNTSFLVPRLVLCGFHTAHIQYSALLLLVTVVAPFRVIIVVAATLLMSLVKPRTKHDDGRL